jgi:uncharacterized protein (UPF0276 family)
MNNKQQFSIHGAGLGLRRAMLGPLAGQPAGQVSFMEVAPENWIGVGGSLGRRFRALTERHPFVCHGLSLSLGGPSPLDYEFLQQLKRFFADHNIRGYSEHLSYCTDDGHLYDLMPIPFTEEAVKHVSKRIRQVQETLEQRIAIENVSYYAAPGKELEEIDFINAVLDEADCDLLLDVNNVYVNSVNHGYDPVRFIDQLSGQRIAYIHVAGHLQEDEDLIIDTHGDSVVDPVWNLLEHCYDRFGVLPTLLERDFNLPPLPELLKEVEIISTLQSKWENRHEPALQYA